MYSMYIVYVYYVCIVILNIAQMVKKIFGHRSTFNHQTEFVSL